MPSHAELAARLLRDAAQFFRTVGEQNEPLKEQMGENANVFEQVAGLVQNDPTGIVEEEQAKHSDLAARLLADAAQFFRTVGEQNQALQGQMAENANVFEQVATLVANDPVGEIEEGAEGAPPAS